MTTVTLVKLPWHTWLNGALHHFLGKTVMSDTILTWKDLVVRGFDAPLQSSWVADEQMVRGESCPTQHKIWVVVMGQYPERPHWVTPVRIRLLYTSVSSYHEREDLLLLSNDSFWTRSCCWSVGHQEPPSFHPQISSSQTSRSQWVLHEIGLRAHKEKRNSIPALCAHRMDQVLG